MSYHLGPIQLLNELGRAAGLPRLVMFPVADEDSVLWEIDVDMAAELFRILGAELPTEVNRAQGELYGDGSLQ